MNTNRLAIVCWLLLSAPAFAAGEFQLLDKSLSGQTLYVLLFSGAGEADAGEAWQTGTSTWEPLTDTWADFDTALTEVGTTGNFLGTMPAIGDKNVRWVIYQDANDDATPDSAADIPLAEGSGYWFTTRFGVDTRAINVTGTATIGDGLIVNRTTPDSSAIVATGNGTGSGLGLVGGATNGNGALFVGAGLGEGAKMIGGSSGGAGLELDGGGTAADLELAGNAAPDLVTVLTNLAVNTSQWAGTNVATPTVAGVPEIDITHVLGEAASASADPLPVNVTEWAGEATAVDDIALLSQLGAANFATNWLTAAGTNADFIAEIQAAGSILTDIDLEPVPTNRTFTLVHTPGQGLTSATKSLRISDTSTTYAVDFANDMAANMRIATVGDLTIVTGSEDGLEFGLSGRDYTKAKIRVTAVESGTYEIDVPVTYTNGPSAVGRIRIVVP